MEPTADSSNSSAQVYDMVISDDLLSPESHAPVRQFSAHQTHGLEPCSFDAALPRVPTTRSMENVLLDTSPMEESIDLGTENVVAEPSPQMLEPSSDLTMELSGENSTNKLLAADDEMPPTDGSFRQSAAQDDGKNAEGTVVAPVCFDDIVEPVDNLVVDKDDGDSMDIKTIDANSIAVDEPHPGFTRCQSREADDALPVGFVEEKGQGIHVAESSRSLCQFFENEEVGGEDVEGKNFFDSFTTGNEDPLNASPSSLGISPHILDPAHSHSLGSVSSVPVSSPRVSITGPYTSTDAVPSPVHRISESSLPSFSFQPSFTGECGLSPSDDSDPFSAGIFASDVDRRCDAWIPTESTRLVLMSVLTNMTGSSLPTHQTVAPYVTIEQSLGDPVQDMVLRFLGQQESVKRLVLNADSVPQDEVGLRQLIKAECLRSAVDLTARLLAQCGQGFGSLGQPVKHTPYSLQLWFCRLSLLMKLRLFSQAEAEMELFGDLDSPDLYHEYYIQPSGPVRRGSLIPFDMRMLHAELPQYVGRPLDTLDRLCYLHAVITKMMSNVRDGLAEDGNMLELNEASRQVSLDLWNERDMRVLYAMGNCLLNFNKDYAAALKIYTSLLERDLTNKANLLSGIGRIYLQLGDCKMATKYFDLVGSSSDMQDSDVTNPQILMDRGLLQLGCNNFAGAYELFKQLVEMDSTNIMAINNMAVCSLYLGRLKEALQLLEKLVYDNPEHHLQEGVLLNLCTLYELESQRASAKKQNLLALVSQHKGNGFNVTCLKLG